MIDLKDVYWVAGLLEGEGCFLIHTKCAAIELVTTDLDVAEKYSRIIGKNTGVTKYQRPTRKTEYRVRFSGKHAISWMMTLCYLMGDRRRNKIEDIIKIWKSPKEFCKRGHKWIKGQRQCNDCKIDNQRKNYHLRRNKDDR